MNSNDEHWMKCPVFKGQCALPKCVVAKKCQYETTPQANVSTRKPPEYFCSFDVTDQEQCMFDCANIGRCLKSLAAVFESKLPANSNKPTTIVVPNASCELKPYETTASTASTTTGNPVAATVHKLCHYGLTHIGDCGKARIWVGKESSVQRRPFYEATKDFALIVSLIEYGTSWSRDNKGDDFLVTGNEAAKHLLPSDLFRQDRPIPFLHVSWPDYGAIPLGRDWWAAFVSALRRIDGDVVLYCMGGHGRTGTAASILAVLCEWVPANQCPVTWVRNAYCRETVESKAQIDYIEEITGRRVFATAGKSFGYTYGSSYQGSLFTEKDKVAPKAIAAPAIPTLSKNKYKALARKVRKQGGDLPLLNELEDKDEITFGGNIFGWDAIQKEFYWLEEATDDEVQPGQTEPGPDVE
jgi:hypothetical protein